LKGFCWSACIQEIEFFNTRSLGIFSLNWYW